MSARPTVAVAGASGFIGAALRQRVRSRANVVALTRGRGRDDLDTWRSCDLFSLRDAERGLEGVDLAVYLVHSMSPSSRLTQGRFEDLDLICADNFARAAKAAGVAQIVYLGGLVPEGSGALSAHLASRLEVERVLASTGVPVTTLRAGLVVGSEGSSLEMMVRLVRRLPLMITPRWTESECQPIDQRDVVSLLDYVLGNEPTFGQTYDVGGPDVLSYRALMEETARALGLRRRIIPVPVLTPGLSRLWVTLVTGAPRELVAPLVESLAHPMVARDDRLVRAAGIEPRSFRASLEDALRTERAQKPVAYRAAPERARAATVRSVQRLPLPPGRDARWVAREYMRWLPSGARPLRVTVDEQERCRFFLRGVPAPLLELSLARERSRSDRQLFFLTGGLLVRDSERGRFELRETHDGRSVIAAVHDFEPSLPWFVYRVSQALVHLAVMHAFARHLARVPAEPRAPSEREVTCSTPSS